MGVSKRGPWGQPMKSSKIVPNRFLAVNKVFWDPLGVVDSPLTPFPPMGVGLEELFLDVSWINMGYGSKPTHSIYSLGQKLFISGVYAFPPQTSPKKNAQLQEKTGLLTSGLTFFWGANFCGVGCFFLIFLGAV